MNQAERICPKYQAICKESMLEKSTELGKKECRKRNQELYKSVSKKLARKKAKYTQE